MKNISKNHCLILGAMGFAVLLSGCGESPSAASSANKAIIGQNDLSKVGYQEGTLTDAIGVMHLGCTVTHIGNGVGITAGHCIDAARKQDPSSACGSGTNVTWGYTSDNTSGTFTSRCTQVLAYEYNNSRDYAVIKLSPAPSVSLGTLASGPAIGSRMAIFSHPQKRTLEFSGWCKVDGGSDLSSSKFDYSCDTEGGSSGAAVLDTNYRVIGIHDGNYRNRYGQSKNFATKLSAIPYFR
jgi:V8-like Glu-specific endopeptidase